jgi:hypothetical protein
MSDWATLFSAIASMATHVQALAQDRHSNETLNDSVATHIRATREWTGDARFRAFLSGNQKTGDL